MTEVKLCHWQDGADFVHTDKMCLSVTVTSIQEWQERSVKNLTLQ